MLCGGQCFVFKDLMMSHLFLLLAVCLEPGADCLLSFFGVADLLWLRTIFSAFNSCALLAFRCGNLASAGNFASEINLSRAPSLLLRCLQEKSFTQKVVDTRSRAT